MLKKMCVTIAAVVPMLAVHALAAEPVESKFKLSLGGFVKMDYVYNSSAVGPFYPQNSLPARGGALEQRPESLLTARQSRFWLKASGPDLLGAKTGSLIEADFFGYSSLSNEFGNMRMRLAYATLDWPDTQVLFGQFWDIWAPVPGNTLDFRQAGPDGAAANPRVPQVRITQKFNLSDSNMIKLAVAVQNPSQNAPEGVTPSTPYGPSVPTANDPSLGTINSYGQAPNAGFQLSFISKALGAAPGFWGMPMKPLEIGLFGIVGKQKFSPYTVGVSPTIYRDKDATVSGLGAFAFVPVLKSSDGKSRAMTASLEAQTYTGKGLAVQGVNTAQLSGAPGMKEMPKALGVLTQGVLYPTQEWGVTAGYGYRSVIGSAPRDRGTERNQYLAFVNTAYDFNAAVRVAAEYEHAKSNFFGTPTTGGNVGATADNGQINTFRLCAMYFF